MKIITKHNYSFIFSFLHRGCLIYIELKFVFFQLLYYVNVILRQLTFIIKIGLKNMQLSLNVTCIFMSHVFYYHKWTYLYTLCLQLCIHLGTYICMILPYLHICSHSNDGLYCIHPNLETFKLHNTKLQYFFWLFFKWQKHFERRS